MAKAKFSPAYKKLCELLIAARKKAGLHQADVARALGVHQSFVSKIESGERRLDVVEFLRVAKQIDVDPVVILREVLKSSNAR